MATEAIKIGGRLRKKVSNPVGGALLGALLAFIVLFLTGWWVSQWYAARLTAELRGQITEQTSLRTQALSAALYRRFTLVEGLRAFVETELNSPDFEEKFRIYSTGIYASTPDIRNIAIGPQGRMQYVYPLEGNQAVIGYNPLNDPRPEVRADAERAIATRAVVLSGPHALVQGGQGLIIRQAVFQGESFWGFANVVIDLQPILERGGLDDSSPEMELALRDTSGRVIYGPAEVFTSSPVLQRVVLEDGGWELASLPKGGWQAAVGNQLRIFQIGGLLIIVLFSSLVYLSINRQSRLSLSVRERTQEITQVNEQLVADILERKRIEERLASLLDVAPDAIVALDENQKVVVFNKAAEAMFGYSAAEALGQPVSLLLPARFHASHSGHIDNFLSQPEVTRRMDERLPIWGRRKDGSEFPAEASLSKLKVNDSTTLTAIVRDISQRKQMEAELREREEQYRSIFESVSDALFITDLDTGELIDFNPAASRMHGYTDEEFRQLEVGAFVHPDSGHMFEEYMQTVRAGGVFRSRALDMRKDGSAFPIEVLGTAFVYRGKPHALGVVRDITEEMEALQLLEKRVLQRTKELQTLLDISRNVASTLDLKALLSLVLEQIKTVVNYSDLTAWMLNKDGEFFAIAAQGLVSVGNVRRWKQPVSHQEVVNMAELQAPVIIPDVQADTPQAQVWREAAEEILGEVPKVAGSWMGIPLIVKNRVIGVLTFNHRQRNYYTPHHAQLAFALASHAAVAIENARLFQTVQRGADRFRAINEMGQRIASILDIDELLSQTAHLIRDTFDFYHVHIGLIDGERVVLLPSAGVWEGEPDCSYCASLRLWIGQESICSRVASTGEPLVVADISQEPHYLHPKEATGSGAVIPLKVKGQVIGLLDVESRQVNAFDESDVVVLQSLANQVAVAIENARLYEQAQHVAALQERQKLARELHDSVSQALYGLALGVSTARALLDKDPARAVEPLEYCMSLAEAGLTEMRALIFELRPESLENEGLVAALTKQAAAIQARHNLRVSTGFCPEPAIPLPAKEALYRIVQEAMNNTVKHARASELQLTMQCDDRVLSLEVQDNGAGFDPHGDFPGHLGLKSMHERAERVGGGFEVESAPGRGTRIRAWVPLAEDQSF